MTENPKWPLQGTGCAAISASDGRWREVACTAALPTACYQPAGTWQLGSEGRGSCPEGSSPRTPAHGKENSALQAAVSAAGKDSAFLPLQGEAFSVVITPSSLVSLILPMALLLWYQCVFVLMA